jgi:hypothetical protein
MLDLPTAYFMFVILKLKRKISTCYTWLAVYDHKKSLVFCQFSYRNFVSVFEYLRENILHAAACHIGYTALIM